MVRHENPTSKDLAAVFATTENNDVLIHKWLSLAHLLRTAVQPPRLRRRTDGVTSAILNICEWVSVVKIPSLRYGLRSPAFRFTEGPLGVRKTEPVRRGTLWAGLMS